MKRKLLLLALWAPLAVLAADNDTLVVHQPRRVTVITNDSLQKIIINGREGDQNYRYENTLQLVDSNYVSHSVISHDNWSIFPKVSVSGSSKDSLKMQVVGTAHLGVGLSFPTNKQDGVNIQGGSSWEIFFTPLEIDVYLNRRQRDFVSFGLGFDWRNYRMTNNTRFVLAEDGHVGLGNYPEGADPKFSRIKVFSISVPLLYHHKFGEEWGFGAGAVFNWNTYASIKTKYKMDGGTHKFIDKNIGQRRFTVDYMAIIYNPLFDFYVKYCPQDVLKEPGVKFRALSIGLFL